jgi:putative transposase
MWDERRPTTGSSSTPCCGCCGAERWHDLPERYGKYKSVHARFMRWAWAGVWERIFAALVADRKNQYLMIDSTIVRARQQAAAGRKKGLRRPGSGAFPRWTEHQDPPASR